MVGIQVEDQGVAFATAVALRTCESWPVAHGVEISRPDWQHAASNSGHTAGNCLRTPLEIHINRYLPNRKLTAESTLLLVTDGPQGEACRDIPVRDLNANPASLEYSSGSSGRDWRPWDYK